MKTLFLVTISLASAAGGESPVVGTAARFPLVFAPDRQARLEAIALSSPEQYSNPEATQGISPPPKESPGEKKNHRHRPVETPHTQFG